MKWVLSCVCKSKEMIRIFGLKKVQVLENINKKILMIQKKEFSTKKFKKNFEKNFFSKKFFLIKNAEKNFLSIFEKKFFSEKNF